MHLLFENPLKSVGYFSFKRREKKNCVEIKNITSICNLKNNLKENHKIQKLLSLLLTKFKQLIIVSQKNNLIPK